MKDRRALALLFRIIHAFGALGLLALAAALSLSLPARAQGMAPMAPLSPVTPLEQAMATCTDPMTLAADKHDLLTAYGWTARTASEIDIGALAAAHIGSIMGEDAEVPALLEASVGLAGTLTALNEEGVFLLWSRDDALLGMRAYEAPAGEALGCYFAAPEGAGIEAFWEGHTDLTPMALSGTVGTQFTGEVFNARDEIAYQELQLYLRVADALSPLTETFRYERVPQQQ